MLSHHLIINNLEAPFKDKNVTKLHVSKQIILQMLWLMLDQTLITRTKAIIVSDLAYLTFTTGQLMLSTIISPSTIASQRIKIVTLALMPIVGLSPHIRPKGTTLSKVLLKSVITQIPQYNWLDPFDLIIGQLMSPTIINPNNVSQET